MTVAVSLYGQPRYIKECYISIYNNIINPNNAKVFGHFWWDHSYIGQKFKFHATDVYETDMMEEFNTCYPDTNVFYEPQTDFDISQYNLSSGELSLQLADHHREMWSKEVIFKQKSAITSMCKSLFLTNFHEPDIIYLTRTDVVPSYPIENFHVNQDTIYIDHFDNPHHLADWIIIADLKTMQKFAQFSNLIDEISQNQVLNMSTLIRYFCKRMGIQIEKRHLGVSIYRDYKNPKPMNEYSTTDQTDWPFWMKS